MNIKKLRRRKGLTQTELSAIIKVPQSTIATWETERALPRVNRLPALAVALGCTVDDLLAKEVNSK